jgi:L-ascorbate metabolism protein UlaG (beta-lactamase superfamily)
MIEGIHWLGHSSFRIDGEKTVYIDPFRVSQGPPADIVLVSHSHYDHCSQISIERLSKPETVIVTNAECARKLRGDLRVISPGQSVSVEGVAIEGVAAYNIGKPFHPRTEGGLGFVVAMGGRRVYFAGDTDLIPEMAMVKADVALLPVSGTYVMTAEEAAEAARRIRPSMAVPMHYGSIIGSSADAARFRDLAGVAVEILPREEQGEGGRARKTDL